MSSLPAERITRNPHIMGGKACVRGMRVTVGMITGMLGAGCGEDELLALYPYLEMDDIRAALSHATCLVQERGPR